MASCVTNPVETRFETITSQSLSTSLSESVSTLPPTTSTLSTTSCLDTPPTGSETATTCSSTTVITSITTIPGGVTTAQVPITVTVPVTATRPTETVFTTSCTETTVITPPPTTITSETSTTLPNGSVVPTILTVTSTLPAETVVVTNNPSDTGRSNSGDNSSSNLAPILGGALGGLAGLIIIVMIVWWFFKRRKTDWDAYFDREDELMAASAVTPGRDKTRRLDMSSDTDTLAHDTEPKPYHYGLVGSAAALSPPSQNMGMGMLPPGAAPPSMMGVNGRTPSQTPLMASGNPNLGPPSSTASRPSTGGSLGQAYGYGGPGPQQQQQVPYQYAMNNLGNNVNMPVTPNGQMPYDERRLSRPSFGSGASMSGPSTTMYHDSPANRHDSMSIGLAALGLSSSSQDSHGQPAAAGPSSSRPLSGGDILNNGSPATSPSIPPRQLFVTNNPATPPPPQSPDFGSSLHFNMANVNVNVPGPSHTPAPENVFTSFGPGGNGGVALGAGAAAVRPHVVAYQSAAMEKARLRAVNATMEHEASGSGGSAPVIVHQDAGSAMLTSPVSSASRSGSVTMSVATGSSAQGRTQSVTASSSSHAQGSSSGQQQQQQQLQPPQRPVPQRQGVAASEEAPPPAYAE